MRLPRELLLAGVILGLPLALGAQDTVRAVRRDSIVELPVLTVTATRDLREVFHTPAPVSVVDSTTLRRRAPASVTDLFFDLPGLDVTGVGPTQSRPAIRGLIGQRILLLEDGIRMNNSRRESDFGEIPSVTGLEALGRVEVVRGPSSVLYGTDAIGGAVNLITRQPPAYGPGASIHGSLGYRFQSAGDQQRPWGLVTGQVGRVNWLAFGSYRDASDYTAPSGTFGNLPVTRDVKVRDTGVRDQNYAFQLGYAFSETQRISARYERYTADDAGFGYVSNTDLNRPNDPSIFIRYPHQGVDRASIGYTNRALHAGIADRLDVTGYYTSNARRLTIDVIIPMGPGAQGTSTTHNFTDLDTYGFRVEAAKALGGVLLTYGGDGFRDRSDNTDTNSTTGFGPPSTSTTPNTPNAALRSLGAFLQAEFHPVPRLDLIAGARVQNIKAETRATPGFTGPSVSGTNSTVVGSLNAEYQVTPHFSLVGTVGRGFRAANLIERFFQGPTPEGLGYEAQAPGLKPETSINLDLGVRLRGGRGSLEVFGFRNEISQGIALAARGDTIQGLPVFTNVNIDKLRYLGLEATGRLRLAYGFSTVANATVFDAKDVKDPSNPVAQSYGFRAGGELRYDQPAGRFWLAGGVRHNGEQKDVSSFLSPVGSPLPAFTLFQARAGARLFRAGRSEHTLSLLVDNLGNKLYSEASNSNFFRPAPGRNVTLSYRVDF